MKIQFCFDCLFLIAFIFVANVSHAQSSSFSDEVKSRINTICSDIDGEPDIGFEPLNFCKKVGMKIIEKGVPNFSQNQQPERDEFNLQLSLDLCRTSVKENGSDWPTKRQRCYENFFMTKKGNDQNPTYEYTKNASYGPFMASRFNQCEREAKKKYECIEKVVLDETDKAKDEVDFRKQALDFLQAKAALYPNDLKKQKLIKTMKLLTIRLCDKIADVAASSGGRQDPGVDCARALKTYLLKTEPFPTTDSALYDFTLGLSLRACTIPNKDSANVVNSDDNDNPRWINERYTCFAEARSILNPKLSSNCAFGAYMAGITCYQAAFEGLKAKLGGSSSGYSEAIEEIPQRGETALNTNNSR